MILSLQTESNGCFSREVGTAPFNLTHSSYKRSLQAKASLMEEGTGGTEIKHTYTPPGSPQQ